MDEVEEDEIMPEVEVNTLSPLFQTEINNFKKDHFKTIPSIHHEFVYSCLHPLDEDLVLCLEKNIYPQNIEIQ